MNLPPAYRKRRLDEHRIRMELLGYEQTRIKRRLKQIEKSMVYDYIPEEFRVRRFTVERKSWFTTQMRKRVSVIRDRLQLLHEKFENPVNLLPKEQVSQKNTD